MRVTPTTCAFYTSSSYADVRTGIIIKIYTSRIYGSSAELCIIFMFLFVVVVCSSEAVVFKSSNPFSNCASSHLFLSSLSSTLKYMCFLFVIRKKQNLNGTYTFELYVVHIFSLVQLHLKFKSNIYKGCIYIHIYSKCI